MCRITGFWDFKNQSPFQLNKTVKGMNNSMIHGGPDDSGIYVEHQLGVALGHRRLSIIDLTKTGQQPMTHPSDRWVICYNGEVYNFKEIKNELKTLGEHFKSTSDTEVILHAWARWGEKCLEKFRGMFAIAIWDKQDQQLTLVRDRVGVKPLYWYHTEHLFMFASELKAFHQHPLFKKEINPNAVSLFFNYGYIPAPNCIFKHAHKLEPGHILTIRKDEEMNIKSYWSPMDYVRTTNQYSTGATLVDELEEQLTEAVQLRMISDVPVGIFLSGGIDSSLVAALAQQQSSQPLKTFTIGFEEASHNEAHWAKKVANHLGTNHSEQYCSPKDALDVIPKLPKLYDEPFGDTSAIPTYLVSKNAANELKVVLSADGGDEQFAGYHHYQWLEKIATIKKIPGGVMGLKVIKSWGLLNAFGKVNKNWAHANHRFEKLMNVISSDSAIKKMEAIYEACPASILKRFGLSSISPTRSLLNQDIGPSTPLIWDTMHYLPDDICVKLDRAAMAVSLEGREPLLDHKLIEWSLGLPYSAKTNGGFKKQLLRDVLYRHIPKALVDRPKAGFAIPLTQWMNNQLRPLVSDVLSVSNMRNAGILNPDIFTNLDQLTERQKWHAFVFQMWYSYWVK